MSVNPIYLDFIARGLPDLSRAFRSVEQIIAQSEGRSTRAVGRGVSEKEREYRKLVAHVERLQRQELAAVTKAEKEKIRSEERFAKAKVRAMISADREVSRIMKAQTRAFEQEEAAKSRAAERWLRKREAQQAKDAGRVQGGRERFARGMMGAAAGGVRTAVGVATGAARALASLGGGFDIADAVKQRMAAQGTAADIANSGYQPASDNVENRQRRSSGEILAAATSAGTPMGFSQQETLGGLSAFTSKSGDLSMGMKLLPQLAELARATGSDFEDLGSAAAEVFSSDTKQSAEDLMATLRTMAGMGKVGAVEIKDLAAQAAKVTASAGMFEGDRAGNIVTLGAIAQEAKARGGATSAAEAMTSAARFSSDVAKGTEKFAALGIKTKGEGGLLRGPEAIIKDSLKATGGDVSQLAGLFGERSVRGVNGFADIYRQAGGNTKDPKQQAEAMKAVEKEFDRLRKASITEAEQKESAAKRMQEVDMQWSQAMLQLRDVTAREFIPVLMNLMPELKKLLPLFGELAGKAAGLLQSFAKNPLEGIGIIIAAKVGAEIANAGLSKAVEAGLSTSLGRAGAITVASAAIAIEVGKLLINNAYAAEDKKKEEVRGDEMTALQLRKKIERGEATPDEIKSGRAIQNKLKEDISTQTADMNDPSLLKKGSAKLLSLVDPGQAKEVAAAERGQQERAIKSTTDELDKLTKALQGVRVATTSANPDAPNRVKPLDGRGGSD